MVTENQAKGYIAKLEVPIAPWGAALAAEGVDIDTLPRKIVAGSNMIAYDNSISPRVRSSVAGCMLLAQLAADKSSIPATPKQWYDTYKEILANLGWRQTTFSMVEESFKDTNVAVHQAIIPFLAAAFGPAAAVGSLIITALQQLSTIDKNSPWITLFDRESRRLNVSDYQFTAVEDKGVDTVVHLAGATLSSTYGRTQVIFFKLTSVTTGFEMVKGSLTASSNLLEVMDEDLKLKLRHHIPIYIQKIPI